MKRILLIGVILLSIAVGACKKDVKAPTDSGTPDPTPTPNPTPSGLAQKMLANWTYYKKVSQNGSNTISLDYSDTFIEFKNDGTEILITPDPQDPQPYVFTYQYKVIDETSFEFTDDNNITYTCTVSQIDDHNLIYYYEYAGIKTTIYLSK